MNYVFVFLVILVAFILWFILSGIFKIIGNFVWGIFDNTKRAINDQQTNEEAFVAGFKRSIMEEKINEQ